MSSAVSGRFSTAVKRASAEIWPSGRGRFNSRWICLASELVPDERFETEIPRQNRNRNSLRKKTPPLWQHRFESEDELFDRYKSSVQKRSIDFLRTGITKCIAFFALPAISNWHNFAHSKAMSDTPPNALGLRSVLGTEFLSLAQLRVVLDTAHAFAGGAPPSPVTQGKTIALCFFELSTRTRISFELAAKKLGCSTLTLVKEASSVGKGETLYDTAKTVEAMHPDVLVLRHPSAGSPFHLNRILKIPVINAGDGFHEHPTQALLDAMTIESRKGAIQGLRVLIVGDIAHSRVARSDIYALTTLGAKVSVCGPPTLLPPQVESLGVSAFYDLHEAVKDQDVVMLLRVQTERLEQGQVPSLSEYSRFYGFNASTLKHCKQDVLIMHPGPVNRGVELSSDVADGPHSVILDQVSNGVSLRMAVLHLLMGGSALKRPVESKR